MPSALYRTISLNLRKALRQGELEEASALVDRLKSEDGLALETRGLELEYMIQAKKYRDADILAAQLVRLYPNSSRIRFLAGQLEYRRKRYGKAEQHFRESLRLHSSRRGRQWLGKTLTQAGQLDEALSILEPLADDHGAALTDLAWLYERKQEWQRAIDCYQRILERTPDMTFAKEQVVRLKARTLDPEELMEEMDTLIELGEPIPDNLLPAYLATLFQVGRANQARNLIERLIDDLAPTTALRIAWDCYRAQVYDLAFDLFAKCAPREIGNFKFLNAWERTADMTQRIPQLIAEYEKFAPQEKSLFGRIKKLKRGMDVS